MEANFAHVKTGGFSSAEIAAKVYGFFRVCMVRNLHSSLFLKEAFRPSAGSYLGGQMLHSPKFDVPLISKGDDGDGCSPNQSESP
jgi:hypothetical protein